MKTPTIEEFKQWARDNKPLALAVCKTQAFAQLERERVDAYVRPIFVRYEFTDDLCDGDKRVLTNPKEIYLSEDEERVAAYFAEVARAHQEHGWRGDPEHCPALVAENLQIKAEQTLLDELAELFGVEDMWTTLEQRAKALDLALTSCIGGVK